MIIYNPILGFADIVIFDEEKYHFLYLILISVIAFKNIYLSIVYRYMFEGKGYYPVGET